MIFHLSQLLQSQAENRPNQVAFRYRDDLLSYKELEDEATRLAGFLQAKGVKPGDRVAIHMPKSLNVPISVYGILKAGAVLVPVDPMLPAQRLSAVLNDADVAAILTQPSQRDKLAVALPRLKTQPRVVVGIDPDAFGATSLTWEMLPEVTFRERDAILDDEPAYIIYTSGSTGEPKGILHTHRSALAYAQLAVETYDVRPEDRLGNFAALHFDQSTFEYYAGPLAGATTVLIPEEYLSFPASLAKLIEQEQMSFLYTVPYNFVQLLLRGALESRDLSYVRWILFGGEPFPVPHLRRLMEKLPQSRFSNVYGPAEVNQCTYYNLPEIPNEEESSIPIGRAWPNTETLVVDDFDKPVRRGEIGELLVRSATRMNGYWGRPELNQMVFLKLGSDISTKVYYRTGDLVLEGPDGLLEFRGRKDRQVKIRGHRIELDEVESALLKLEGVEKAAVFATIIPQTDKKEIVALVVGRNQSPEELRNHLVQVLPSYALPTTLRSIEGSFPQTTSGKVDYRKLETRYLGEENNA